MTTLHIPNKRNRQKKKALHFKKETKEILEKNIDEFLQNLEARKNFLVMTQILEAIKIKADKFNIFMKDRKSTESN